MISNVSAKFDDYYMNFCVPTGIYSTGNENLISELMNRFLLLDYQPTNANSGSGGITENFNEENGNPIIHPCMATEALTIIAFECLENFIDLEQTHSFTNHLPKIFDNMNRPGFKPLIFGLLGFLELSNTEPESASRSSLFDELIITQLSLP